MSAVLLTCIFDFSEFHSKGFFKEAGNNTDRRLSSVGWGDIPSFFYQRFGHRGFVPAGEGSSGQNDRFVDKPCRSEYLPVGSQV